MYRVLTIHPTEILSRIRPDSHVSAAIFEIISG